MEKENFIGTMFSCLFVGVGYSVFSGYNLLNLAMIGIGSFGILEKVYSSYEIGLPQNIKFKPIKIRQQSLLLGKISRFTNLVVPFNKDYSSMLIAGKKGSGKSTLLKCILDNLFYNQYNINYYFIDLKMVELARYREKQNVRFTYDNKVANEYLKEIREEIDNRNKLLLENKMIDIEEYNKKNKMSYILLVIEEIVILNKENKKLLDEILSIGRSAGVLVILTTQRPDKDTCSSFTKAQMDYIVGLSVIDRINAQVIGIEGLEDIKIKGRAKLLHDKIYDFQSFNF